MLFIELADSLDSSTIILRTPLFDAAQIWLALVTPNSTQASTPLFRRLSLYRTGLSKRLSGFQPSNQNPTLMELWSLYRDGVCIYCPIHSVATEYVRSTSTTRTHLKSIDNLDRLSTQCPGAQAQIGSCVNRPTLPTPSSSRMAP